VAHGSSKPPSRRRARPWTFAQLAGSSELLTKVSLQRLQTCLVCNRFDRQISGTLSSSCNAKQVGRHAWYAFVIGQTVSQEALGQISRL